MGVDCHIDVCVHVHVHVRGARAWYLTAHVPSTRATRELPAVAHARARADYKSMRSGRLALFSGDINHMPRSDRSHWCAGACTVLASPSVRMLST